MASLTKADLTQRRSHAIEVAVAICVRCVQVLSARGRVNVRVKRAKRFVFKETKKRHLCALKSVTLAKVKSSVS